MLFAHTTAVVLPTQNSDHSRYLTLLIICTYSLWGLRFLFRMLRPITIFILDFSPTVVRAFNRFLFSWEVNTMFPPTSYQVLWKLWLLLCYLRVPFRQLASPPGFRFAHILKGNLVYTYISVCVLHVNPFSFYPTSSTPRVLADSLSWIYTRYKIYRLCGHKTTTERLRTSYVMVYTE